MWDIQTGPFSPRRDKERQRNFTFYGTQYKATAWFDPDEDQTNRLLISQLESSSGTINPDRENWLAKRVRSVAETYTSDRLGDIPLVIAALNFSDELIVDAHIHGILSVEIDSVTDEVVGTEYDGTGLWRDSKGPKEKLTHVHAVCYGAHGRTTAQCSTPTQTSQNCRSLPHYSATALR